MIIVDDGSTDDTYEIIQSASQSDLRIRTFRQNNQGPLIARRTALGFAKGEYVVFLDSDDMLRKNALETIHNIILKTHVDIVSYPYSRFSDFSQAERGQLPSGIYDGENYRRVKECICRGRFCNLWDKVINLHCVDLDFDYSPYSGLMHGEDFFQLIPIIDKAKSLARLSEPLYFYRERKDSSTSCFREKQLEDIVKVNSRLFEYANKWGTSYVNLAIVGEIKQYVNLMKIVERGYTSKSIKQDSFNAIRKIMISEGVFTRSSNVRLRVDDRIVMMLLKEDQISLIEFVLKIVEILKLLK